MPLASYIIHAACLAQSTDYRHQIQKRYLWFITNGRLVALLDRDFAFLPRDARAAKCGIAIVSRPSVRLPVTLIYRGRMYWVSSKLIKQATVFRFAPRSHNIGNLVQGEHPENSGWGRSSEQKTCNISETGQDRTKVTIDDQITNRKSHTRFAFDWCQSQLR